MIIFGNNNLAEMLYYEAEKYSDKSFTIEAFCVDHKYIDTEHFCGKPLFSLEEIIIKFPPNKCNMISTALCSTSGLRQRMIVFNKLKKLGYTLANYISPLADVCQSVQMGENNIILSFSRVGLEAKLGNANILWNGVILDHNANVGDGNFFAGGCKMAGHVSIGNNCWIGINSTIIEETNIADETLVGAGAVIVKNTQKFTTYVGNPARAISTHQKEGIFLKQN